MIPKDAIKAMCQAWYEMNVIRARDGVPYYSCGTKADVSQEHWDNVMHDLDTIVKRETGQGCHCHPSLYGDSF